MLGQLGRANICYPVYKVGPYDGPSGVCFIIFLITETQSARTTLLFSQTSM